MCAPEPELGLRRGVPPAPGQNPDSPSRLAAPGAASACERGFLGGLTLVAAAGLALRVAYVLGVTTHQPLLGDAIYYSAQANTIAAGRWFADPFHPGLPAADHPPLTALVLAPISWASGESVLAQRLFLCLVGTLAVAVVGLLGRELAGPRAGLLAGGIAALYPNLWINDGLVMSESLAALVVAGTLLAAYRLARHPSRGSAIALGAACGLAVLVRAELALAVPLVALPAALAPRRLPLPRRLQWFALTGVVAAAVVSPWAVYNLTRFERPVLVSSNDGLTLLGANTYTTYHTPAIGLWDIRALPTPPPGDQSVSAEYYRERGLEYLRANLSRVPAVMAARVGRVWSVYEPGQMIWYNQGEGREPWVSRLGLWSYWLLLPTAAVGGVLLRLRGTPVWPLAATAVIVTLTALAFYGLVRFRIPAEIAIAVLAGVALDGLSRAVGHWLGRRQGRQRRPSV